MDLKTFFEMQEKLDNNIIHALNDRRNEVGLDAIGPQSLINERVLALIVECGELANALKGRGFKYWSQKQPESKERLLDEYVDILHFWLSIGLSLNFTAEEVEEAYRKKNAVNFKRQEEGY